MENVPLSINVNPEVPPSVMSFLQTLAKTDEISEESLPAEIFSVSGEALAAAADAEGVSSEQRDRLLALSIQRLESIATATKAGRNESSTPALGWDPTRTTDMTQGHLSRGLRMPMNPSMLKDVGSRGGPAEVVAVKDAEGTKDTRTPVWIDTDIGIGLNRPIKGISVPGLYADPDDAYALLMALNSPELDVQGVSIVHGNHNNLGKMEGLARESMDRFGAPELRDRIHVGGKDLAQAKGSAGVEALAAALREKKMTIVALGPLTNIAATLEKYPELASQIEQVVAVAGRHPDQEIKLGRVSATDFNIAQDHVAAQKVVDAGVPMVLAPFELSHRVWLNGDDMQRLAGDQGTDATKWLAKGSKGWMFNWKLFGEKRGFNPFDVMAVAVLLKPEWFTHAPKQAYADEKLGMVVEDGPTADEAKVDYIADFAGVTPEEFKEFLMERLLSTRDTLPDEP